MSDVPSWARVGAKVVCVDDRWDWAVAKLLMFAPPDRLPMINEVLVISAVSTAGVFGVPICTLIFEGDLGHRWRFDVGSFRPLVASSEEQDIALFREIADRAPVAA